jgi:hypothetical protein
MSNLTYIYNNIHIKTAPYKGFFNIIVKAQYIGKATHKTPFDISSLIYYENWKLINLHRTEIFKIVAVVIQAA